MRTAKRAAWWAGIVISLAVAPAFVGCSPSDGGGVGGNSAAGSNADASGGMAGASGSGGNTGTGGEGGASGSGGGAGSSGGQGGTVDASANDASLTDAGASDSLGRDSATSDRGTADAPPGACPTVTDFQSWPTGDGPADVGMLAANDFKTHTRDTYGGAGYALALSWYGALRFTLTTGNTQDNAAFITAFEPYANGTTVVDNSATATVDFRVFGVLPLEIYLENHDARDQVLGLARADAQWQSTTADGITTDARYWIDDMYMITGLQVMAYRATRDTKYFDRAAKTMLAYLAALQQSTGLFWHTRDSKAYWGRANGWVASGMTELLFELPAGATRDSIMAAFKKEMDGLLPLQISGGNDDGCWRQVLDLATSSAETSCTAMFTYALVNGVKNGWLTDPKYAVAARRGWLALANKTNTAGKLDRVCPGTGAAPAGTLASQQAFYANIALGLGDLHGQAPLLWSSTALLRNDCPGVR